MTRLFAACLVAFAVPSVAAAQAQPRPVRQYRGLFGGAPPSDINRLRHELTFTGSGLGGFDDYITLPSSSSGPVQPGVSRQHGFTGAGDARLAYWVGRQVRWFSAEARTFANAYSVIDVDPTVGAESHLQFQSQMGRRNRIDLTQSLNYQPTLVLGAFAPLGVDVDPALLPDDGRSSGLVEQRSWTATGAATLERRWSARHSTTAAYNYGQLTYVDGVGFDNRTHTANLLHTWNLSRAWSLRPVYRFSDMSLDDSNASGTPITNHNGEVGLAYTHHMSATRQVAVSWGGGTTHVTTVHPVTRVPLAYWTPSGYASFDTDIGRSWSLSMNYRRAANVLPGVTVQAFATDALALQAEGFASRRLQLVFSAGLSNGRAEGGTGSGRFDSYNGTARMRFALSQCCAALVSYDYYKYSLRDLPDVPTSVPPEYDRNAVRFGMTFWLPLYGARSTPGEPTGGR